MMNTFYKRLILALTLLSSLPAVAQEFYVEYTYLGTKTKAELFLLFFQQVDYDVNLYKITYITTGSDQLPDTASGLITTPVVPAGTPFPIVMFGHGTTSGPTDVPSQLRGGYEASMAYAGKGFIVFSPDYLGLGDSRGFHPYVHAATEASASLDMLHAGIEWLELHAGTQPAWNPAFLFLTGYSQGGHASMALHREIEANWSFVYPVTAATHMSGPYSLSGVMRDLILGDNNYGNPAYIAYIALGYQTIYGNLFNEVAEVFKEPYASDIDSFYHGLITLGTLNGRLTMELIAGGNTYPKRMFQDSILEAVMVNPDHPFNLAMADNDTYAWAPDAPTKIYYCSGDDQVPYQNSLVADSVMNDLGAADVEAIDLGPNLDHGLCVFPAFINSITYFLSFLEPSSVLFPDRQAEELVVYPNPASDEVTVDWEKAFSGMKFQFIDISGRVRHYGQTSSNSVTLTPLDPGVYTILCTAGHETRMARIVRL